ncbi:hypothetical protein [Saccharothrix coeruleofusca]|uniref:Extradiol ring-cleavage dioxygenase LigAB LigA subunit domain-containing protein n=1 Tax=Saccharothrix coeruleofusca TaxID=33919 RepID=A0A918AS13_9PSEU|nr:hypothetical protein [Saccharothrix coeruleofusca]MBP2335988.1 putative nuclease with RNAse H fold [Saccharothrix coeruleofusca]GGP76163.1 hypothetical protein GCM10010185_57280 [Saccharothrix coeruleofusca]
MSVYEINRICYLVAHDDEFRGRLRTDPRRQLDEFALTEPERAALLAGDVRALYDRGAHPVLLVRLGTHRVLGLTPELYAERIRTARPGNGEQK